MYDTCKTLLNLISKTPLWATSAIILIICLLYILRGGFKLSIITDKYQFFFIPPIIENISIILRLLVNLSLISEIDSDIDSIDALDTASIPEANAGQPETREPIVVPILQAAIEDSCNIDICWCNLIAC